jgi:Kef-type K+ transport system membrane component KefB/nucleotide-binding universal stress UspA family protein
MGAAMSITAFPVLARILTERNLHKSPVGAVTITCAAVDDVTAWCMLAFVVGVARATGLQSAMLTAALSAAYVLAMFFLVRPFLRRLELLYERQGRLSQNVVAVIFMLVLASAWTTEAIGIHALFGAFLMGAIMPKGSQFIRHLSEKLEDYTVVLLLPIFFAYTGLRTRINLLNSPDLWALTGLIIFVACLGKFGGSTLAARACGMGWRESSAIGILMNTRGLMELVILNIGRELGVITDAVFAMMVIMALVTTFMTTPILNWVYPDRLFREAAVGAPTLAERAKKAFTVLIPVSDPRSGGHLLRIADLLSGAKKDARQILALHLKRPVDHDAYRTGLDDAAEAPARDEALAPLLEEARDNDIPVEPISFVTRDVAEDVATVAQTRGVDLLVMGYHKPVIGRTILGGTVHRVLTNTPADIAIFVDRGFPLAARSVRILVPYLGSPHDRLAMDLAARMAKRMPEARTTVLHVVPPKRGGDDPALGAKTEVDRAFSEPGQSGPVRFKVVEDGSPVDAILREAADADLVLIGVAEEWGLESHLFGFRPHRITEDAPSSLLIVRKYARPVSAAPTPPAAGPTTSAPAATPVAETTSSV